MMGLFGKGWSFPSAQMPELPQQAMQPAQPMMPQPHNVWGGLPAPQSQPAPQPHNVWGGLPQQMPRQMPAQAVLPEQAQRRGRWFNMFRRHSGQGM